IRRVAIDGPASRPGSAGRCSFGSGWRAQLGAHRPRLLAEVRALAPARDEAVRLGGASLGQERRDVLWCVDVQAEAGQGEDAGSETALARGLQVARARRLAEGQR